MTISEFKAEGEVIRATNIIRILSFGIKDGVPRMWAITDPLGSLGIPSAKFTLKKVGSRIDPADVTLYVSTLHEKDGDDWFIFGEKPKLETEPLLGNLPPNMPPPPGGLKI